MSNNETLQFGHPTSLVGRFLYRRVGYDERLMELMPGGSIGFGHAACERRWSTIESHGSEYLMLEGDHGTICRLKRDSDGVWRGRWLQFERMPVELYAEDIEPPALIIRTAPAEESAQFAFISYEKFVGDIKAFAERLPPLKAVVGNLRSGMIPAAIIALARNVPLLPISAIEASADPEIPTLRRRSAADLPAGGEILVVDDTIAVGRQFDHLRSRVKAPVKWAAVYAFAHSIPLVDYYHSVLPNVHQTYEWTILHDHNAEHTLVDLDGVLCADWTGDETADPQAYQRFLESAAPLRLPTNPVLGIVTGRLQVHRAATERWLHRHNVPYGALHIMPACSEPERDAIGPAAFKAAIYQQHPQARVFIESCEVQAREIARRTGRPVICFSTMRIFNGVPF